MNEGERPSAPHDSITWITLWKHPVQSVRVLFFRGSHRSVKAKKNIAGLFILRGIASLVNLLLVPLTLTYLNPARYGIWVTLTSIIGWAGFLDIGLGNGLRNKLAESIARGDEHVEQIYISTTYAFISLIATASLVVFSVANPFLSWSMILNTSSSMDDELHLLALMVFAAFCLKLVLGLIGTVLVAHQRPAAAGSIDAFVGIISLGLVWFLTRTSQGSLFWLGIAITAPMVVGPLLANLWFFGTEYRRIRPEFRFVRKENMKDLMNLGVRFFILQISGVVVFSSANLLISQLYGPDAVTPFNIAFKYYGVAATAFSIILTPFWSAYTDAYVRGDLNWIVNSFRRLKLLWGGLVIAVLVMTLVASPVYAFWLRGKEGVQIPFLLSALTGFYVIVMMWCSMYVYFINGVGKIRLQLWGGVSTALVVIPLNIVLSKVCGLGIAGVSLGMALSLLPWCFVWPIQVRKILSGDAKGIWNK